MPQLGLYDKFEIRKKNGDPIGCDAKYFVLRIDNDLAAQRALKTYAENTDNKLLSDNLLSLLSDIWLNNGT